ncbi:MAG: phosphotransferase family protein [Alphaproteobacteria bacterium]|nr:phosphotransferase family protein [Alphaproteobacteria bacterium]MCW5741891.1 phosphotransferase family protein [Alphaproteobacteria bacterium]
MDRIADLPCWRGRIEIAPLAGGMTNSNFLVTDSGRRYVVRLGEDIPLHGVMRFNELAASRAAHEAGLSPAVIHAEPGAMVLDYIDGRALTPGDVRDPARLAPIVELIRRCHRDIPRFLRGPLLAFNVFHVLRDYMATLLDGGSPYVTQIAGWTDRAMLLEAAVGPIDLVFGHNDLLAGNLLDDGNRLWLIDWDYAGFNSPLFDLGGLASNNGFDAAHERALLTRYFGQAPDDLMMRRYAAMKCASLMRETLWSMVSELTSRVSDVDFAAYTRENRARFEAAWAAFGD